MTTAAAAGHPAVQKKEEKRRALGRGLESLLPGPRVVSSPEFRVPSPEIGSGAVAPSEDRGDGSEKQVPHVVQNDKDPERHPDFVPDDKGLERPADFVRNDKGLEQPSASEQIDTARTASAFHEPELDEVVPGEVISIQAVAEDRVPGNRVADVPIRLIQKNPYQTRSLFDEDLLRELAESIKEHGVVQPVVVRPAEEEGRYILVLGERRLRASKMAGKDTIPAMVRRLSLQQAAEMTVLENVVREDLNPIEQAQAFKVLSQEFKLTQAQIAQRIGVSRESVANYMRLLRLPEEVTVQVAHGRVSFSEARELLALEDPEDILVVLTELLLGHHTLEQIAERVRRLNESAIPGAKAARQGGARWVDPNVRAAQMEMERTLGMRVRIADRNGKGKIVIEYASVDDYERVTGMLRSKK